MTEPIDNPDLHKDQAWDMAEPIPDPYVGPIPKHSQALVVAPPLPVEQHQSITPAQARVEAVANVLHKAYEKASTLQLTPEEVQKLKADFPHDAFKLGAGGNDRLIYIEHAYLRDRFDEVIGMGQWALVRSRPHWGEEFVTGKGQKAVRIYADCALLIRGCLVSEAIGEMVYYPNNAIQSYGDAAEGSETAAFRRCAKKIGVGLQAWKKDFCAEWMNTARGVAPEAKNYPVHVKVEKPSTKPKPTPKFDEWLEACRQRLLDLCKPVLLSAWQYAVKEGWILDTERLDAVTATKMFPGQKVSGNETDEQAIETTKPIVSKRKEEIMAGIQAVADGERDEELMAKFTAAYVEDKPTEPEQAEPEQPESTEDLSDCQQITGEILAISCKSGTSSRGKWTCYGVLIGKTWFNTFDTKLGKRCEALKNQQVTIHYRQGEKGNDLVAVNV